MRVKLIPKNPKEVLSSTSLIPDRFIKFLLPTSQKELFSAKQYQYLEQRFIAEECCYNQLDILTEEDTSIQPEAEDTRVVIVQMWKGNVRGKLYGSDVEILLREGNSYIFYLPKGAAHHADIRKGHTQVGHFYIKLAYLERISSDYPLIKHMVDLFSNEAKAGYVGKPAVIDSNTIYLSNQIKHGNLNAGVRELNLPACALKLVEDYVTKTDIVSTIVNYTPSNQQRGYKVFKAKEIIDTHKSGKLPLDEIAKTVGMSKRKLSTEFKKTFDTNIGEYIIERRIAIARILLAETEASVMEIALKVGYDEKASFTRIFKRKVKQTPSEYRNAQKESSI